MSVEIEPAELGFRRPFTQEVSEILRIKNPNSTPVAFKVKTTAPKQYCVRPNSGRIEPGKAVEVTVLLQAMKQEPPLDAKCRDKFLVQSVAVTADKEFTNIAAIWQHVDNAEKSTVQEKKIRVVFQPASTGASSLSTPQQNGVSNSAAPEAPPAYNSPSNTFTPNPAEPVSRLSDKPAESKSLNEIRASANNPATSPNQTFSTPSTSRKAAPTMEDLKSQSTNAKAQIPFTREGDLRQRNSATSNEDSANTGIASAARPVVSDGVSVQITAALCLVSFLIAYFLF